MPSNRDLRRSLAAAPMLLAMLAVLLAAPPAPQGDSFRFVILGDRTGEAQPGVYEQVWKEAAAENPAFAVSVGDTIQGLNDSTAEAEWRQWERVRLPYRAVPLYLAPGNHDVWSPVSERLFRQYAGHPPHYGFDFRQAHFTILDNSRDDRLSADEMAFLEKDLREHAAQPVKFIVSHRPGWLIDVALANAGSDLHRLARQYGVRYAIAGHVHQMLHADLEGVSYVSMPSAGGHLRLSGQYGAGWFFAHALVEVQGREVKFQIEEVKPPLGQGRVTGLADWGLAGRRGAER